MTSPPGTWSIFPRNQSRAVVAHLVAHLPRTVAAFGPACALLVAGFARRWMDDDGFINLRVVRNLLHGAGPVYNPGERVEAVTSPLWVGLLALVGALGARLEYAAAFGGIGLAAVGVLLAQRGAERLNAPSAVVTGGARAALLPIGAAIFVVLPPAWDYASAGLETGLSLAWLGASLLATAGYLAPGERRGAGRWTLLADAALIGQGSLIRPELVVYALVPLAVVARAAALKAPRRLWPRAGAIALVLACAGAMPLAYQVFRMGYYAAIGPNTAIAKEAFLENWSQGRCYFDNFFGTYQMRWPLAAAAVLWGACLHAHAVSRRWAALGVALAAPLAAAAHALYVVRVGGDYMHGRMLLLPVFVALWPVAAVPVSARRPSARALAGPAIAAVCVWLPVCALWLRVGEDNVCDIGDERGWYARQADTDNPVLLESYRKHPFYGEALAARKRALEACPSLASPGRLGSGAGCRLLHLNEDERKEVPLEPSVPLGTDVDPRVGAVLSAGAVGMFGYLLPSSVHVVDRHGLADPVTSRRALEARSRPGHEKTLPAAWMIARFSEAARDEDASVAAARRVMSCGLPAALRRAVEGPLTLDGFVDNVVHAWDYSRLRLPADPFVAETEFCGTPPLEHHSAGGGGGARFDWRCPAGFEVHRLRGTFSAKEGAVASVRAVCGDARRELREGPWQGEESTVPFEVECPASASVTGIFGTADHLVRSVGLVCSQGSAASETTAGGDTGAGRPFSLSCAGAAAMVGVEGRAGALVDAIGVVCR